MQYYIDKILEENEITTFLRDKGIYPVKTSGDKIFYSCPIHEGDNDPSFVVYKAGYKGRKYQTYYCFGCHCGINIINLKRDLDKISSKNSIEFFLNDMNIDKISAMESIINDIKDGKIIIDNDKKIEILLLKINSWCHSHLVKYNDEDEMEFFNKFLKRVDDVARSCNFNLLQSIYDLMIIGMANRAEKFNERVEEQRLSAVSWSL